MPELIVFVGFQASGKSTYYLGTESLKKHRIVSKDKMSSSKDKQQAGLLEQYLGTNQDVVVDNTNMSVEERAKIIVIGKKYKATIKCYWFTTPFEECMARNLKRIGKAKVPAVAMYVARKRFKEPTIAEGFDAIQKLESKPVTLPTPVEHQKRKVPTVAEIKKLKAEAVKNYPPKVARAALFLDKDGVLVDDSGYPHQIPMYTLLPGVKEALIKLSKQPIPIFVVSNQSWVGNGRLTMVEAVSIFETLQENVGDFGARIDACYFCPHKKKENCQCRKPGIGMLKQAAEEHNIDLMASTIIGDMATDIECGKNANLARTVLVGDKGPDGVWGDTKLVNPTHIFGDLQEAVNALYPLF